MVKNIKIKWSLTAKNELKQIYSYNNQFSNQGATNVKNDILKTVSKLVFFPEKYPIEQNLGSPYRYAVVRNYKIIHTYKKNGIFVLSIFDTRQSIDKMRRNIK